MGRNSPDGNVLLLIWKHVSSVMDMKTHNNTHHCESQNTGKEFFKLPEGEKMVTNKGLEKKDFSFSAAMLGTRSLAFRIL